MCDILYGGPGKLIEYMNAKELNSQHKYEKEEKCCMFHNFPSLNNIAKIRAIMKKYLQNTYLIKHLHLI